MTLFLVSLDNNTMEEIKLFDGDNKLFLDLPGDNECLISVGDSQNKSVSSVEQIDKYQTKNPPSKLNIAGIGDVNVDLPNNRFTISTNRGKGITTVSNFFFGDRKYLTNYNENLKQASGVSLQNLEAGIYSLKIEQFKSDIKRNDLLLAYNGKNLVNLAESNLSEIQNSEIEVPYGLLYLIACDTVTTSGVTEFLVTNLMKSKDLDYIPPKQLPLTFQSSLGRVSSNKNYAIISTGTGSRSFKTIVNELNLGNQPAIVDGDFTEGGYGTWELENGKYRLTYQLKTSDKVNLDSSFLKNNGELVKLVDTSSATIQYSKSQNISEEMVIEVDVNNGKLTPVILDSETKTGSSEIKFTLLELLELFEENVINNYSYYDSDFGILAIKYTLPVSTSTIKLDFDGDANPFDTNNPELITGFINGLKSNVIVNSESSDKVEFNLGLGYPEGTVVEFVINNVNTDSIQNSSDKTIDLIDETGSYLDNVLTITSKNSLTVVKAKYTETSIDLQLEIEPKLIKEVKTIYLDFDGDSSPFTEAGQPQGIAPTITNGTILDRTEDSILIELEDNNDGKFKFTLENIDGTKIGEDTAIDVGINGNDLDFSTNYSNYVRLYSSDLITLEPEESEEVELEELIINETISGSLNKDESKLFKLIIPKDGDYDFDFTAGWVYATIFDSNNVKLYEHWADDGGNQSAKEHWDNVNLTQGEYILQLQYDPTNTVNFESINYQISFNLKISYLIDTTIEKKSATTEFEVGGELTKKSFNIRLEENSELKIILDNHLINELIKDNVQVYYTEYSDKLIIDLEAGEYQLNFFTEGSEIEFYQLNISAVGGFNIYQPIESEPPSPQPITMRLLGTTKENAFNFGTLNPWENDSNSGQTWNKGYLYSSAHLGHSNIKSSIIAGKDEICCFEIPEKCYLNLFHSGAEVVIESAEFNQIIGRNDDLNGQLQLELTAGKYYLKMSSTSDVLLDYNISIYLSKNDPNYAD